MLQLRLPIPGRSTPFQPSPAKLQRGGNAATGTSWCSPTPHPTPPHPPHHPSHCLLSAHKQTNETLNKKKTPNKAQKYHHTLPRRSDSSSRQQNRSFSPTPHAWKDLQWPPSKLSICIEFTGEEMRRGSGGMQDGGQGTGSLHTGEEGRFFKETSSSICLSRLPSSLSLSLLAHLLPLHPPLRPSQAESVMTVRRSMAGCGGAWSLKPRGPLHFIPGKNR